MLEVFNNVISVQLVDMVSYILGWKTKAKLLIIGLDNAGKSTLLDRVADGRMIQHEPTARCRKY